MGWDNTTEQTAALVDAVNVLIRLTYNVNAESPNRDEVPRVPRPYEVAPERETISLAGFASILTPPV